jgi:multiple sugar transport system ATP-binding protein
VAEIAFDNVSKVYGKGTLAVEDLSLEIEDGEFMVLVGPSGCGKTTALRMVAGLEEITEGEIRIGDEVVNDLTPKERDIAMVFQNYALYPHMTVEKNLAFGLAMRKLPKQEIRERVQRAAKTLEIEQFLKRKPRALSGGQRQRVAMGRAIVREPQAFLMDEPLSNLDAQLRVQMRVEIHSLQRRLGVTTIYVTHDQVEAMTMGDRVAVMSEGRLQQVDQPEVLYRNPVNEFVAGFIGSPSINLVESRLERRDGGLEVEFGDHRLPVDDQLARNLSGLERFVGRDVVVGIRPESFDDASLDSSAPSERRIQVTCDRTEPLGSEVLAYFTVKARSILPSAEEGDAVYLGEASEETSDPLARLVARIDSRTKIVEGSPMTLAVDTSRLYFFDPESKAAI